MSTGSELLDASEKEIAACKISVNDEYLVVKVKGNDIFEREEFSIEIDFDEFLKRVS